MRKLIQLGAVILVVTALFFFARPRDRARSGQPDLDGAAGRGPTTAGALPRPGAQETGDSSRSGATPAADETKGRRGGAAEAIPGGEGASDASRAAQAARAVGDVTGAGARAASASTTAAARGKRSTSGHPAAADAPSPGTGLLGRYWRITAEGTPNFADVAAAPPALERIDARLDFPRIADLSLPFLARRVVARWRGFLRAPEDGVYTLTLASDDGSSLILDGTKVIDLGGVHELRQASAEVPLLEGYHAIEVRWFNWEQEGACILSWVPPGGAPEAIPTEFLYPTGRASTAAEDAPAVREVTPARARRGERVTITGSGFGGEGVVHRATFGAAEMRIEGVEPGRITAILPPGIDRDEVVVWVDGRPGAGLEYEAGDAFGLLAEYVRVPADAPLSWLYDLPPPGAPGSFRRIEPRISFLGAADFALPFPARSFGARFQGALYVPSGGPRALLLSSDDGGRLSLDGKVAIDDDGKHPARERQVILDLAEGLHDIAIDYFQDEGGVTLRLRWALPGGPAADVPRANLYPTGVDLAGREPPTILGLDPDTAAPGATVEIAGRGFAGDGASDHVTISGAPAPVVSAGPSRLVVRVPEGAVSGPLVVETLGISSRPVELRVGGHGLRAAYFRLAGPVERLPSTDGRAPDLERVEPTLDFTEPWTFKLPADLRPFAARYTGAFEAARAGEHQFLLTSDDGARLYIDGRLVADNDGLHAPTTAAGAVVLERGLHAIRVDYFDMGGFAALRLGVRAPGGVTVTPIPEASLGPDGP